MSPIADVLHRAADLYLWDGTSASSGTSAWHGGAWVPDGKVDPATVHKMLAAMGCQYGLNHFERQARRYQWLKFAALAAEQ